MNSYNLFNINVSVPATDSNVIGNDLNYASENHRTLGFPRYVVERALKNAIKSREFEIQMYWKRASYFWLFVSALWVAFGKLLLDWGYLDGLNKDNLYQFSTLLVLSFTGLGLSVAWYFVNKGSKFWQENWEYQINFLENEIIGKSYKTILSDRNINVRSEFNQSWFGSFPFSVSKINVIIAFSSAILWFVSTNYWASKLILNKLFYYRMQGLVWWWLVSILLLNLILAIVASIFINISKSSFDPQDPNIFELEFEGKTMFAHQRRA